MTDKRTSPTVNPVPCPKLFDTSLSTMIDTTSNPRLPMKGTNTRSRNQAHVAGRPAMRNSTMNW